MTSAFDVDVLMGLDVSKRPDPVAVDRRGFEVESVRGLLHGRAQALLHLLGAAGQEALRLRHELAVAGFGDAADTGRRAALDLVHQAGPRAARENGVRAGAQQEGLLEGGDRPVDRARRGEGAKVDAVAAVCAPVLGDLWVGMVAGDQDVGKGLVVAQQHVVARHKTLDQVALEQQGLDFGVGVHDLEARRFCDHALQPPRQVGELGVAGDPFLQVLRLADIERFASAIQHAIDPRRPGQGLHRLREHGQAAAKGRRLRAAGRGRGDPLGRVLARHGRALAARGGVLGPAVAASFHHDRRCLEQYPKRLNRCGSIASDTIALLLGVGAALSDQPDR
jgi:hypothetical protein